MKNNKRYSQYKTAISGLALPLAWLDMDMLDLNIAGLAQRSRGVSIRVVSKSIRSRGILEYILSQRGPFKGVMCYHPAEAAWLASQGLDDLLVAYPSVCETAIDAVCQQIALGRHITLMIDCVEHAMAIRQCAIRHGVTVPVCLDLDMSVDFPGLYFGVYRSPVRSVEDALSLWRQIADMTSIRLRAVMGYEAQIAGVGDKVPGKWLENRIVRRLKEKSVPQIHERRQSVVDALKQAGAPIDLVNGGGTGSIETTISDRSVTEVAVGSGFFSPRLFDYYSHFKHQPAAGFATPIVRTPRKNMFTAYSGGYIASGSPGPAKVPFAYLPAGIRTVGNEGSGEVQTPFSYRKHPMKIGDPVFWRHAKAGELCERFDRLHTLRNGSRTGEYLTYRGEGKNFH